MGKKANSLRSALTAFRADPKKAPALAASLTRNRLFRTGQEALQNEQAVREIAQATGIDYAAASEMARKDCDRLGISLEDYSQAGLYLFPPSEQKAQWKKHQAQKRDRILRSVAEETGWSMEYTRQQYRQCRKLTGCLPFEYRLYRMYELTEAEQAEVLLHADSMKLFNKYNGSERADLLKLYDDKIYTDRYFSEYLGRKWTATVGLSLSGFRRLFADTGRIVYKPAFGTKGRGIEVFCLDADGTDAAYRKLKALPAGVVEEYIVQHPDMDLLNPGSVNTIRAVTVSSSTHPVLPDGRRMDIAFAMVRIGNGSTVVDNFHSGGMAAAVDLDTGMIATPAVDGQGTVFYAHPVTATVFQGFQLPFFTEALNLIKEIISHKNVEGFLGWDIAISVNGPVLVELNPKPGVSGISAPYAVEHRGMKHVLSRYLWDEAQE